MQDLSYLTYQDVIFQKTHNLSILLELCIPFSPDFEKFRETIETLTPYATGFRYPQDVFEPEQNEAVEAIEMADSTLKFVTGSLPSDILTALPKEANEPEDSASHQS